MTHKYWVFTEDNCIPDGFDTEEEAVNYAKSEARSLQGVEILIAKVIMVAQTTNPKVKVEKVK